MNSNADFRFIKCCSDLIKLKFNTQKIKTSHMKAAVLNKLGTAPVYQDIAAPTAQNEDQLVMTVKAASVQAQSQRKQ